MTTFDRAFALTVGVEGGYSDDAEDPGCWATGADGSADRVGTKWGISARALGAWRQRDVTAADMRALSLQEAGAIYRVKFWEQISADELPAPIAGLLFDCAVNQGPDRAVRWLQQALGVVQDGVVGPKTLAAAGNAVPHELHAELARLRDEAYRRLAGWPTFGTGWIRRLMRVVGATASFS